MKKMLIYFGIAAGALTVLWVAGFYYMLKKAAPEPEMAVFNSRYGFSVRYPNTWQVDDSRSRAPAEFINEPHGNAFVAMQVMEDARLKDPGTRLEVKKDAEESFRTSAQFIVERFDWQMADGEPYSERYHADGIFTDADGKEWRFKEIGILHADGTILLFRGMTIRTRAAAYAKIIDDIIASFRPLEITADSARANVVSLPEVQEYQNMLAQAGKQATIEVEDQNDAWAVHAFEVVQEDDGASHTATFNWYRVDKKTGAVEAEF